MPYFTYLKKYLSYLFYIYLINITSQIVAQTRVIDSLRQILRTAKEDTAKAKVLNNLSWKLLIIGSYDTSLIVANNAKTLSIKLGFKKGIAASYLNIGNVYKSQSNYEEALKNYFASLKVRKEIGDKKGIANSYNNIGTVYSDQGNYAEALKNYVLALEIRKEIGDENGLGTSANIIVTGCNIRMIFWP